MSVGEMSHWGNIVCLCNGGNMGGETDSGENDVVS